MKKLIQLIILVSLTLLISCEGGGSSSGGGNSGNDSGGDTTPANYKVELSWDAPDERENGDHLYLYEIGGYEIIWRKVGEEQWSSIIINDEDGSPSYEYVISELSNGRYEFAIATFDIDGLFGRYSNSIFVDI